jgi:hypothetical protein
MLVLCHLKFDLLGIACTVHYTSINDRYSVQFDLTMKIFSSSSARKLCHLTGKEVLRAKVLHERLAAVCILVP